MESIITQVGGGGIFNNTVVASNADIAVSSLESVLMIMICLCVIVLIINLIMKLLENPGASCADSTQKSNTDKQKDAPMKDEDIVFGEGCAEN